MYWAVLGVYWAVLGMNWAVLGGPGGVESAVLASAASHWLKLPPVTADSQSEPGNGAWGRGLEAVPF